jgi:phosphoribosyl-AMP cyclohydrolase / phosphoribosyl-ATP pyrophosphohydrolase
MNSKPNFSKSVDGLLPALIQDAKTRVVLMQGYMNEESYQQTLNEGKVWFYSRSKQRLWKKGEESGNELIVAQVLFDCDADSILIKAHPKGPVCHTGSDTCFNETNHSDLNWITELESVIAERKEKPVEESYVASLFDNGLNKIIQKVGEEAVEVVIEAKDADSDLFLNESADLIFHFLILLNAKGHKFEEVVEILRARHNKRA